jgi:hypothetical protein
MAIASVKASWEGDVERLRLIVRTPHAATVVAALRTAAPASTGLSRVLGLPTNDEAEVKLVAVKPQGGPTAGEVTEMGPRRGGGVSGSPAWPSSSPRR